MYAHVECNSTCFRFEGKCFLSFRAVPHPYKPTASRSQSSCLELKKFSKNTQCLLCWKSEKFFYDSAAKIYSLFFRCRFAI